MLKQAENVVKIEGILSEIKLEYGSYVKDGRTVENIGGSIIVRVNQTINGQDVVNEIPIQMFANKYKNDGKPNPAYASIEKVKTTYISLAAAAESGVEADRVRITNGDIRMNEYYASSDRLVSFPRINASFVNRVKKEDFKPEASFLLTFVVGPSDYEVINDENTGRYLIHGIVPQYGGRVDIVPLICASPNVINAVSSYWQEGDTVKASGKLNFTSKTETVVVEQDFGDPIEQTRTTNVSELFITGGNQTPLDGDFAYDAEEIRKGLAERKDRLAAQKEKDVSRQKSRQAPAPAATTSKAAFDLGF